MKAKRPRHMTLAEAVPGARGWVWGHSVDYPPRRLLVTVLQGPYRSTTGHWAVVLAPDGWRTNRETLHMALFLPLAAVYRVHEPPKVRKSVSTARAITLREED